MPGIPFTYDLMPICCFAPGTDTGTVPQRLPSLLGADRYCQMLDLPLLTYSIHFGYSSSNIPDLCAACLQHLPLVLVGDLIYMFRISHTTHILFHQELG